MSGEPWFRFFASDWLGGTVQLSAAEKGVYITLIARMYDHGEPIVRDDSRLARQCGLPIAGFRRILSTLVDLVKITLDDTNIDAPLIEKWLLLSGRPSVPCQMRREVFARDGNKCIYCGNENGPFHLDHAWPLSRGGETTKDNLVVACRACNLSKGARVIEDWRQ